MNSFILSIFFLEKFCQEEGTDKKKKFYTNPTRIVKQSVGVDGSAMVNKNKKECQKSKSIYGREV